jgi:hypothetical protein
MPLYPFFFCDDHAIVSDARSPRAHVYVNGESPVESGTPQLQALSQLALQTSARTGNI